MCARVEPPVATRAVVLEGPGAASAPGIPRGVVKKRRVREPETCPEICPQRYAVDPPLRVRVDALEPNARLPVAPHSPACGQLIDDH